MCVSCSVMSNSLQPYRLWPTRLLCPWDSPGKNTGVGCHALCQGNFQTQGSNLSLMSHALAGTLFTTTWEVIFINKFPSWLVSDSVAWNQGPWVMSSLLLSCRPLKNVRLQRREFEAHTSPSGTVPRTEMRPALSIIPNHLSMHTWNADWK